MNWTQYFLQKIKTVPPELQDAILAVDFLSGLKQIQKKYLLHIDQGNELEGATFRFMFGDISSPDEFKKELMDKLVVPTSLAITILDDIEKLILSPIRQKLQEIEAENIEESVEDILTLGKTKDGETYEEIMGEEKEDSVDRETLQTGTAIDHSTLSHEDILSEIENPTPVVRKEVIIESNIAKPQAATPASFTDIASNFPQKRVGESVGITRPKESVAKTASVLQSSISPATTAQKLTETTASKPKEINIPADPYRESF